MVVQQKSQLEEGKDYLVSHPAIGNMEEFRYLGPNRFNQHIFARPSQVGFCGELVPAMECLVFVPQADLQSPFKGETLHYGSRIILMSDETKAFYGKRETERFRDLFKSYESYQGRPAA